jgi:putative transposase
MPRRPRYAALGQPQHVIQRGNNRSVLFGSSEEYRTFADYLREALTRHECLVHAYVLMTNHVHLLITPRDEGGIGRVMQSVGIRYVRYFNRRHGRTGTLWEGRYRATLIDSDRYLLTCCRYIESNPVRARLTMDPAGYQWSSYAANAHGVADAIVTPHPTYLALAADPDARQAAYRSLFLSNVDPETMGAIRRDTNFAWPLGSESFRRQIGEHLKCQTAPKSPGRQRRDGGIDDIRL